METSEFSEMQTIMNLVTIGRNKAAVAKWNTLREDFRLAVMQFVKELYGDLEEHIASCPTVPMKSAYGQFELSYGWLEDLKRVVPMLIVSANC